MTAAISFRGVLRWAGRSDVSIMSRSSSWGMSISNKSAAQQWRVKP